MIGAIAGDSTGSRLEAVREPVATAARSPLIPDLAAVLERVDRTEAR